MKMLGGLTLFLQTQAIKGLIYFEERKMLEILAYALNREGFFIEGLIPDFMAPAGNLFLIYA